MHVGLADVGNFNSTDGGTRFHQAKVPNDSEVKDADAGGGNMKSMDLNAKLPSCRNSWPKVSTRRGLIPSS